MKQEQFFEAVIDSLNVGIAVIDQEGRQTLVNKKFCEMTGFKMEELVGSKAPFQYWAEDEITNIDFAFKQTLLGVKKDWELLFKKKNGERFLGLVSPAKYVDTSGKTFFIATVQDVTQVRKIEEELKDSGEKYRMLVEESNDAILVADAKTGFILDANHAAERMLGRAKAEIIGLHQTQLHSPDDADYYKQRFRTFQDTGGSDLEAEILRKDGLIIPVSISTKSMTLHGKRVVQGIFRDISERKLADKRLRESEEKYRILIENASDLIYMLDEECNVLSINQAAAVAIGRKPEEIIGKSIFDLFPKELASLYARSVKNVFQTNQSLTKESKIIVVGKELWINTSLNPVRDSAGKITSVIGASRDITEHKRLEDELQESEKRYRLLFENMLNGFAYCKMLFNDEGRPIDFVFLSVNNAFGRLTELENVVGKKVTEVAPFIKEVQPELLDILGRVTLSGQPETFEIEFNSLRAWLSISVYSQEKEYFVVVFENITERKRAEDALRESEEKYRAMVENSPNFVAIYQEGIYKYVNKAMCERLGWTFDEMTSPSFDPIEKLLSPEYRRQARENVVKRLNGEDIVQNEFILKTKSDAEIPVIVHATPVSYKGKTALEYIFVDITERKQAEADRIKTMMDVTRSIGHDLRNPLQAILTASENIRSMPQGDILKFLELIDRNVEYAAKVVRNLRDFTELPTPKLNIRNINSLLQETLNKIIIAKNIRLTTSYGEIPATLLDGDQLNRAFTNLVMNALQSMLEGGELNISTALKDNFIEVRIKDTGVGIPKEKLEKIFTPFFTTKAKGTGLGLYTAKKIVETQGGLITLESEEKKGTTVTVQLPRSRPEEGVE
ncbi:MAG: PAS domain S-box protein [Thaumarchaeota archaeon]|nr:PAS domain S-box protein [Nitrososphaerota archaeon]